MVAATAEVHGMIVVTRNACDFAGLGARTFNPFRHPRGVDDQV
jgi:predicted nucleic acid-binding protein